MNMRNLLIPLLFLLAAFPAAAQRGGGGTSESPALPDCAAITGACPKQNYICESGDRVYRCVLPSTWTALPGADTIGTSELNDGSDSPSAGECLVVASDTSEIEYSTCGAGSGAFSDASDPIVQNTTGKDVHVGDGAGTLTGKLEIGGDADQPQLVVEGHSSQTDSLAIFQNDADTEVCTIDVSGLITTLVGLDAIGAVDMDYGSADVTDHTFVTDGTGTAEVVLPAGSIDSTEILDGTIAAGDLGTDSVADDEIDYTAVTCADLTMTDCGAVTSSGTITATVGFDIVGAADMDYGSADVTDHTFTTDGTGTAEVVLPAGSIDSTEILDATIQAGDIGTGQVGAGAIASNAVGWTDIDFSTTAAGDPAFAVDECFLSVDGAVGGGFICEGSTADTTEFTALFPDINSETVYRIPLDDEQVTDMEGTGLSIAANTLGFDLAVSPAWTGAHDFGGATSVELPQSATPTTDATGEIALDTTITDHQPLFQYEAATTQDMTIIAIDTAELPATDNEIIKYDAATDKFVLEADATGGAGVWTDADPVLLNTPTRDVVVGTGAVNTSKLTVDGDADQVQLTVQGNGTQTDSIVIVETSAGTEVANIDASGNVLAQSIEDIDGPGTNWEITAAGAATFAGGVTAGASATPNVLLIDSTTSGEGRIIVSDAAGPDAVMDLDVDVAGTLTTFLELDGVNSDIELGTPGTNYVDITTGGVMTFVGTGDIDLPNNSVDTADITDANVTEDKLAASLAFDDGDLLDFGTNISSATEGILLPSHATTCASATAEAQICWNENDDELYVGDGSGPPTLINAAAAITDVYSCNSGNCNTLAVEETETLTVAVGSTNNDGGLVESTVSMVEVQNNTGATLYACTAVYLTGGIDGTSNLPYVDYADADQASQMPAIGILSEDVTTGSRGHVVVGGVLKTLDTLVGAGDWAPGEALYVADVAARPGSSACEGNLTNTRPPNTDDSIQKIGQLGREHATLGSIFVQGAGRSNDVPNLQDAYIWVGNGSNVATAVDPTGDVDITNTGTTSISTNVIVEADLNESGGSPADNDILTYNSAGTNFTWTTLLPNANGGTGLDSSSDTGIWRASTGTWSSDGGLEHLAFPTQDVSFTFNDVPSCCEEISWDFTGDFTTGNQFAIRQLTGNPAGGVLFDVRAADPDVTVMQVGDGTNGISVSQAGLLEQMGTGGVDPDALTGDTTDDNYLDVAAGGTGVSTLTDGGVLIGNAGGDIVATAVLTEGQLLIGDGTTDPSVATMSGDATIASSGALTIANNAIENTMMADNSVDSDDYVDGSVDPVHLANLTKSMYWGAGAMEVDGTQCTAPTAVALVTGGPTPLTIACADSDAGTISGSTVMPDGWDASTVTFELTIGQIAASTGTYEIDFEGQCIGSDEPFLAFAGTGEQAATITLTADDDTLQATTSAVTLNGTTCAAGDVLVWRGAVDATASAASLETLAVVVGVKMEYGWDPSD